MYCYSCDCFQVPQLIPNSYFMLQPALEDIKMLDRAIAFLFLHFVMCSLSPPLYPPLRYNPLSISGKAGSFQLQEISPVHSYNLSVEEQEENFLIPIEKRLRRHANAIFTDSYRKVRGKVSARKLLQGIVGKRLKEESLGDEQHEILTRRQSDSIVMDSHYHQQMVLKNFLGAMLQNQGPQDVANDNLEDFTSVLIKVMEL
ncbi:somatoliberin [Notechis scutatus]|uniref:Somatoliberin n=1 Tax=Notechis scutatus TaxID=8663 RepID=A0A6J1TQF2_9SAUR|nr:somatoliberin [Notechis scutatus]